MLLSSVSVDPSPQEITFPSINAVTTTSNQFILTPWPPSLQISPRVQRVSTMEHVTRTSRLDEGIEFQIHRQGKNDPAMLRYVAPVHTAATVSSHQS